MRLAERLAERRHNRSRVGLTQRCRRERSVRDKELGGTRLASSTHRVVVGVDGVGTRLTRPLKNERFNGRQANIVNVCRRGARGTDNGEIDVLRHPPLRFENEVSVRVRHRANYTVHSRAEIHEVEVQLKVFHRDGRHTTIAAVLNDGGDVFAHLSGGNLNANAAHMTERNEFATRREQATEGEREGELTRRTVGASRGGEFATVEQVEVDVGRGLAISAAAAVSKLNLKTRLCGVINLGLRNHIVKTSIVIDALKERTADKCLYTLYPRGSRNATNRDLLRVGGRGVFEDTTKRERTRDEERVSREVKLDDVAASSEDRPVGRTNNDVHHRRIARERRHRFVVLEFLWKCRHFIS